MKLELHILQNFAPSNLNRDDTGAPKDCEFGGHRRARISSQCLKRAIREAFEVHGLLPQAETAARTKRLVERVAEELHKTHGRSQDEAGLVAHTLVEGVGFGLKEEDKTEYLLYVPRRVIADLAQCGHKNWDALKKIVSKKKTKAEAKADFPKELKNEVEGIIRDASRTADLALFGRMIADKPDWNVEAACQVAHALSTNRVSMEFDFFTAVDDLKPDDTAGSDMMGTVQFNSACFYRYSVLDTEALKKNLAGDSDDLARRTVEAFVRASVLAIPTGKQNSMAAQNLPSYVLAVTRGQGSPVSLANAFLSPVRPAAKDDLVGVSLSALEAYLRQVTAAYGSDEVRATCFADRKLAADTAEVLQIDRVPGLDGLVDRVQATLFGSAAG